MANENCQSCKFWKYYGDDRTAKVRGQCNRYPPTVTSDSDGSTMSEFPESTWDDWCGEYVELGTKLLKEDPVTPPSKESLEWEQSCKKGT